MTMAKQEAVEVYNYNIDSKIQKIESSEKISEIDKKLILKFMDQLKAEGLSKGRVYKNISFLKTLCENFGLCLNKTDHDKIVKLIGAINNKQDWEEWTKHDYKAVFKRFLKWHLGDSYNSKDWEWIKLRIDRRKIKMPAEGDILTVDDVERMIQAAFNPRDKALIAVLYQSACRPSEILTLKIRNVKFDLYGAILYVQQSKTSQRPIRITNSSASYLNSWINVHPDKNNQDAPLWISMQDRNKRLDPRTLYKTLILIASKAGLCKLERDEKGRRLKNPTIKNGKRIYPYLFRHSRITHLLTNPKLSHSVVKKIVGWTDDSSQIGTYLHMSDETVDRLVLESDGVIKDKEIEGDLNLKKSLFCYACKTPIPHDAKFCVNCNFPLDFSNMAELFAMVKKIQPFMSKFGDLTKMPDSEFNKHYRQYAQNKHKKNA